MTDTATRTTAPAPAPTAADQILGSDLGLLVLRVVFGGLFAVHGAQKLFGWFGGRGLDATIEGFDKMGYNPGALFGTLAGLTEFVGGLALLAGLFTPLAAAAILGTMVNAIYIKLGDGLLGSGGYELALLYAVPAITLALTGPGRLSLDHGRPWARQGLVWGGAAIALGIVTAVITLIFKAVL